MNHSNNNRVEMNHFSNNEVEMKHFNNNKKIKMNHYES